MNNNTLFQGKLMIDNDLKGFNIKIPDKYLPTIINMNILKSNEIPIFQIINKNLKIKNLRLVNQYLVVQDYHNAEIYGDYIYVSYNIFHKLKKYRDNNGNIHIKFIKHVYIGKEVKIKPLNIDFLKIQDQMMLLQNSFLIDNRILYPGQYLQIYSFELDKELQFYVNSTVGINSRDLNNIDTTENIYNNVPVLTTETNLTVEFNCQDLIKKLSYPKPFQNPIIININENKFNCACDYLDLNLYNGDKEIEIRQSCTICNRINNNDTI